MSPALRNAHPFRGLIAVCNRTFPIFDRSHPLEHYFRQIREVDMEPMSMLVLATAVFIATHFVPSTPLRPGLVAALGEKGYLGLYSLVALAGLGWMIWAYARVPYDRIWVGD